MDEIEKRLKEDAAGIRADVSRELKARIDASILATEREPAAEPDPAHPYSLWWASSLTGLTAALLIIVLLNRNTAEGPVEPAEAATASTTTVVPKYVRQLNNEFLLKAENAVFTEPLEEELERLKADIEKARNNVRRKLGSSL